MKRLVIAHAASCYGFRRVSHALPLAGHRIAYKRVRRVPLHRMPWAQQYLSNRYTFFPRPAADAVHLFNGICTARIPWLSSFEMEFPRYFEGAPKHAFPEALDKMASDDCRILLPLSEAARDHFARRVPETYRAAILPKLQVFTGGVEIDEQALERRQRFLDSKRSYYRVGFVGRDFWRKGGPAIVEAVSRLRKTGVDLRLLLVSDMLNASYVYEATADEYRQTCELVSNTPWIEFRSNLPNHEVLRRIAECDVFAFPSFDESLGWVAIEAGGLGVPTVASNAFAMPELVQHGINGLTVDLPLDADRRWRGLATLNPEPRPSYQDSIAQLTDGCEQAFGLLLSDNCLRERMGLAARAMFETRFTPALAAAKIAKLLRDALNACEA